MIVVRALISMVLNLLAMICALPDWLLFISGKKRIRHTQLHILRSIMRQNSMTVWGKKNGFNRTNSYEQFTKLPLTDYINYKDFINQIRSGQVNVLTSSTVTTLLPTSGTTLGSKLIPFTMVLQKQFRRALNVWFFNLYLRSPSILFGRQYWSMSPITRYSDGNKSAVTIGFSDDTSYFGWFQRKLISKCFAVPLSLQSIDDPVAHEYLTLLFLLSASDLSFLFIWSPTFLIAKLDKVNSLKEKILFDINHGTICSEINLSPSYHSRFGKMIQPDLPRANALSSIDFTNRSSWQRIWPRLKMISCWSDGSSSKFRNELSEIFPGVQIEEKGLVATEGVVTIPWWHGESKPIAYRSHFYEFFDIDTKDIQPLWKIVPGKRYTVIITTGGGLYRYQLHDVVEVIDFVGGIPCLRFIGRENATVDLVGEKITEESVLAFFRSQTQAGNNFTFALVAPSRENCLITYTLFIESPRQHTYDLEALANQFDEELCQNYHYHHARNQGQLQAPNVFIITPGTGLASYMSYEESMGKKAGDIKIRSLDSRFCWSEVFQGQFLAL